MPGLKVNVSFVHSTNEELQAPYSSGVQQRRRPQPHGGDLYVPRDVARCRKQLVAASSHRVGPHTWDLLAARSAIQ